MCQKFLSLLFGLIHLGVFQAKSDNKIKSQKDEISKVKVYIIHGALEGERIERIVDVECGTFLKRNDLDSFDLTDYRKEVTQLLSFSMKKTDWPGVDTRAKLLVWHQSGKADTICMCYLPQIMINSAVYYSDSTKHGFYYPYDNLLYLLRAKIAK